MNITPIVLAPVLALAAAISAPAMDSSSSSGGSSSGGGASSSGGSQSGSDSSSSQQPTEKLSQLPEAGQRAVLKEAAEHEGRVSDLQQKTANGQPYYVASLENQDHAWQVKLSQDGKIVEIKQKQTSWEEVPQAVQQAAIKELDQDAMITKIETTRRNGQQAYKVDIEKNGQGRDVVIGTDGKKMPTQNPQAMQQVQQQLSQLKQQSGSSQAGSQSSSSGGQSSSSPSTSSSSSGGQSGSQSSSGAGSSGSGSSSR